MDYDKSAVALRSVQRLLNEKVVSMIRDGDYQIHPFSMKGSQGEYARVDLIKADGSAIVRLVVDRGSRQDPDGGSVDYWEVAEYHYLAGKDYTEVLRESSYNHGVLAWEDAVALGGETLWLNEAHRVSRVQKEF